MTRFSDRMERIREDLIRRAHTDRIDAMERGAVGNDEAPRISASDRETQERKDYNTRLAAMFSRPLELFSRRPATTETNVRRVEPPKSPEGQDRATQNTVNGTTTTSFAMGNVESVPEPVPAVVPSAFASGPAAHEQDSHRSRPRGNNTARTDVNKRFLFCFPWIASGRVRVVALHCFTSGVFTLLLVAVCK